MVTIFNPVSVTRNHVLWLAAAHFQPINPRDPAPNHPRWVNQNNMQGIDASSWCSAIATLEMLPVGAILTKLTYHWYMDTATSKYHVYTFINDTLDTGDPSATQLDYSGQITGVTGHQTYVYTPDPVITLGAGEAILIQLGTYGNPVANDGKFSGVKVEYTY